jgi:hypothetical protein
MTETAKPQEHELRFWGCQNPRGIMAACLPCGYHELLGDGLPPEALAGLAALHPWLRMPREMCPRVTGVDEATILICTLGPGHEERLHYDALNGVWWSTEAPRA